jgi:hypothetical protein
MKKGSKIKTVEISNNGYLSAKDESDSEIKLSRSERNALSDYKNRKHYVENIIKAFGGNQDVLSSEFTVYKDGVIKFTYTTTTKTYE